MMRRNAFSIIELLVVVAIIAIIAAIAAPAYSIYSARAKIASTIPILTTLANIEMKYYSVNGSFATAQQLGMGSGAAINNPTSYSPYITTLIANAYGSCPHKTAEVSLMMDNNSINYTGTTNTFFFEILVVDKGNGTITTSCYWRNDNGLTQALANTYLPSACQTQAPANGCT